MRESLAERLVTPRRYAKSNRNSSAGMRARSVLGTMNDGQYDDLIGQRLEVDCVREASYERAAHLTLDARIRQRRLEDAAKRPVDLRGKDAAQLGMLIVVPVTGVK